jgi:zinc/manganese transport system permease protein
MLEHEFIRNALLAGSAIALASGVVGYFLVQRVQVFAADALTHVAFTGTLAAALAGIDLRLGLFGATVAVGLLFAALGNRARSDDVAVGVVFVWVLGVGVLLLDLFNRRSGGSNGVIAARTLFGSIFSLTGSQVVFAVLVAGAILAGMVAIARPLLYSTVLAETAEARGVAVGAIGAGFLVLLALDAAEATQAVGALLLLGLLAAPAGAAIRLTSSPAVAVGLSACFGVVSVWLGTTAAYLDASLPPSSAIVGVAVAIYAAAFAISALRR